MFTKAGLNLLVAACAAAALSRADVAAELADLSSRIEYGFYAQEPRVIDAARAALERSSGDDPSVRYWRAFAALRLAQSTPEGGRTIGVLADECVELATPQPDAAPKMQIEGWILVAACATLGVQHGTMDARRRDQALGRARERAPDHPRVALVEAWIALPSDEPAGVAGLERAIEAFRASEAPYGAPSWGEAEALARLGEIRLQRGEIRASRDLIERALLIAPDYRFALTLRARVQRPQ
jgi:hypothetical protein